MGKLWIFFRADLPERKKSQFPSWAGAEKFAADLNFGEKTAFLLRLVQDPARSKWPAFTSFYGRSNSDSLRKHPFLLALLSAIKPKETVKLQTDTKTQRNILLVSLFYSFHSRKSKVQRYSAFADLSNIFLILSLLYFQRSPVTRHRRVTYSM